MSEEVIVTGEEVVETVTTPNETAVTEEVAEVLPSTEVADIAPVVAEVEPAA